ncbi:CheB methylesterase domain-containing protein [Entomospira culicis]|uniref:protein-glutamate methylesterase n=1 Tax=Entomospira culicis TaxID=2719989 RepID=A0A968GEG1_9SPIO|nr:CheB methylesterase domain-containing protein [Entomospira culicis]NIZ18871.1 chemotaxis protein CheB [Entomospira culicis]NIZ69086.1 chemotaxis protein CheB [Entomospira culicis]WDI37673.1 CheB methylesterase domain-containing protein [Entomospira culicis]WDI39301.1 CheB methylesterase domain-containing protein [Entomospira culicis]
MQNKETPQVGERNLIGKMKDWPKYEPTRFTKSADIVCIGISTGGPAALIKMLGQIEEDFPLPIVIVQHIPLDFVDDFVRSLSSSAKLPIRIAEEGQKVKRGEILVAPGNQHLTIVREGLYKKVKLTSTPAVGGHRPSVDVLFASVAQAYHGRVIAVLMTGMGKDGAREMGELYNLGAITVAQDEKSSVVYGMPKAAVDAGYVHYVVSLDRMAKTLISLANKYSDYIPAPAKS